MANQYTTPISVEQRYWAKVNRGAPAECWEWTAYRSRAGYGSFASGRHIPTPAHRFAWEIVNGPVPQGMLACHHCDNRACCNPSHLFVGTHADNSADMVAKGRQPVGVRGGRNPRAKLTEKDVQEVLRRLGAGGNGNALAREKGVHNSTISRIKNGHGWKHVVVAP